MSGYTATQHLSPNHIIEFDDSDPDHAIPPATQWFMAHRAHAHIETVKASHVPYISRPGVTTDLILEAAHSIS